MVPGRKLRMEVDKPRVVSLPSRAFRKVARHVAGGLVAHGSSCFEMDFGSRGCSILTRQKQGGTPRPDLAIWRSLWLGTHFGAPEGRVRPLIGRGLFIRTHKCLLNHLRGLPDFAGRSFFHICKNVATIPTAVLRDPPKPGTFVVSPFYPRIVTPRVTRNRQITFKARTSGWARARRRDARTWQKPPGPAPGGVSKREPKRRAAAWATKTYWPLGLWASDKTFLGSESTAKAGFLDPKRGPLSDNE